MKTPLRRLRIAMQPNLLIALVCVIVAAGIWWVTLHRIELKLQARKPSGEGGA